MTIALVDNGSVEPAAHRHLRSVAAALAARVGVPVAAVSWKHSDRVPESLIGEPAWVLPVWLRAQLAKGEREFLFVPFFISAQGAIGSALRRDLARLAAETGGFDYDFSGGLAGPTDASDLAGIVSARVREAAIEGKLDRPAVVVVDHGGPSAASAELRDRVTEEVRRALGGEAREVAAASMESPAGPEFGFNRPLLAERLSAGEFARGDVVIAPLFLSPGRHAGPDGDLFRIARAAEARAPGLRCHLAGLVGTHPLAVEILARALPAPLST